jgi:hypothetical protein
MDEWIHTTRSLTDRLKFMPSDENSPETQVLEYLSSLLVAAGSGERSAMEDRIFQLKHFWFQSVPWCSTLSKEIEKIVIQYNEYAERFE